MKKVYIIAEAGVNHCGSLTLARDLVRVAAEAGADAVKFQTFKTENLITASAKKAKYQEHTTGASESQSAMLKKLELPYEWHFELKKLAESLKIDFLSTPFDFESLDFLTKDLGLRKLKIASGDNNNVPFLYRAAQLTDSMILSTGYMTISNLETALGSIALGKKYKSEPSFQPQSHLLKNAFVEAQRTGALKDVVSILHCTSEYPPKIEHANLRCIQTLKQCFDLEIGFSDHTTGVGAACAAVALGATILEKHFTLDKTLEGPDHPASLNPQELKLLIDSVREVEAAMGSPLKIPTAGEEQNRIPAQKSVIAIRDIKPGEVFSEKNIVVKRPGGGLEPKYFWDLLGKTSSDTYRPDDYIRSGVTQK